MRNNTPTTKSKVVKKYSRERCPNCNSDNLRVVRDSNWPHLECADCNSYVRDFGD